MTGSYISRPIDLIGAMQDTFDQCIETARKKNADYAGAADPFANFRCSEFVGVSMQRGILVRVMDKIKRASNLLDHDPQVVDETLADTLSDAINYLAILKATLPVPMPLGPEDFAAAVQAREADRL